MSVIYDIIINLIDYLIIFKYFNCFGKKRNLKNKYCISIFFSCIVLVSVINQLQNQYINLILCILMIYLYSLSFSYGISYHIVLPILYIGFGIVAELIGFVIFNNLGSIFPYPVQYYGSSFICEFIRYLIVCVFCSIKKIKFPKLSFKIGKFLVIIPISSIVICCIAINIIQNSKNNLVNIMCMVIIIMTITSNILMFKMFFKVIDTLSDNYEKEMLLQEAEAKEQYYKEVEKSNREVRKIKHDFKNMLLAICGNYKEKNKISEEISKIIKQLDESDKKIYTSNVVINTIINNKISQAEKLNVKTEVNIKIPKSVSFDYKDAGILLGNILDNAIEACERINQDRRWIQIDIFHQRSILFIKVCNGKIKNSVNINKSSKSNVHNHGIGVTSINAVVKKYDGYVEFVDKGEEFEVDVSLYGIIS
jgi:two-component system sensor histidine kinase AgrC